jgi:hypothetical protein
MKKLIEIVYDLLIGAIKLRSFVVLEFGVRPVKNGVRQANHL